MRWRSCTSSSRPAARSSRCTRCAACSTRRAARSSATTASPPPAQKGDAVAARLVGVALQYAVSSGTGRPLVRDGLGRLGRRRQDRHQQRQPRQLVRRLHRRPPGGGLGRQRPEQADRPVRRHRWHAGVVGRVRAPAQRAVANLLDEGLDWRWVEGGHSTDAGCPGARRFAFVAGYAPGYQACVYAPPPAVDEYWQPDPRRWPGRRTRRAGTRRAGDPRLVRLATIRPSRCPCPRTHRRPHRRRSPDPRTSRRCRA